MGKLAFQAVRFCRDAISIGAQSGSIVFTINGDAEPKSNAPIVSYRSISRRVGSSIAFLIATRKVTASRPSIRR
ncbi:hypothetical protein GCM10011404_12140 [Sphingomonas prati]|nr:hypothetical protein GCM10011404_12140 [Sphingomonas prati]